MEMVAEETLGLIIRNCYFVQSPALRARKSPCMHGVNSSCMHPECFYIFAMPFIVRSAIARIIPCATTLKGWKFMGQATQAAFDARIDLDLGPATGNVRAVQGEQTLAASELEVRYTGKAAIPGAPEKPAPLEPFPLILHRRSIAGSVIGGIRETQEMLDFCAEHKIESDVEVIPIQQVNEAYERVLKRDVRFRFVIDLASLR